MHGKFTADQFALARIERNRRLLVLTHRRHVSYLLVGVVVACPLPSWRFAAFQALFLMAFLCHPVARLSPGLVVIAAAALAAGQSGESVEGGTTIRMRVEAVAALGADPPPMTGEQGVAKEVGEDFQAVETPFIALGADAHQARPFGEKRKLNRLGHRRAPVVSANHQGIYQLGDSAARRPDRRLPNCGASLSSPTLR